MKKNTSKIIRVMVAFCIVVSMSLQICACNKTAPLPDKQEMFKQIHEYEDQAKFTSALELHRKMCEYGYITAEQLKEEEKYYLVYSYRCKLIKFAVDGLKDTLKDPHSLVIYGVKAEIDESRSKKSNDNEVIIQITLDYGAKNSFGGMVREEYQRIIGTNIDLEHRDNIQYILDISFLMVDKESQFTAIIKEEAEYDTGALYRKDQIMSIK
jgi:hypothetical protein